MLSKNYILLLATIVFGSLVLWFDMSFTDISITPICSITWLMIMSFRQSRAVMLGMFFILIIFVFVSLSNYSTAMILIRTTSFGIAGTLAMLFAGSRLRSKLLLKTTLGIIEGLPAIVVAADANGTIVAASNEAKKLLEKQYQPLVGHHFSDVFMGMYSPGEAIRIFYECLKGSRGFDDLFIIRHIPDMTLRGRIMINGRGADLTLTAIFTAENEVKSDRNTMIE